MNSRHLKILAIIIMTVDHVGAILLPDVIGWRLGGRLAFPLFAFLIAYGCTKTRNIEKFFIRLLIFGIISQIVIQIVTLDFFSQIRLMNIFFTLAAGVACILVWNRIRGNTIDAIILRVSLICVILVAGLFLRFDYGIGGIMMIFLFYLALRNSVQMCKVTAILILLVFNTAVSITTWSVGIQWLSMLSLPFILLFIDQKLKIPKWERWLFYIYYPTHLAILFVIMHFI